jgi:hypothetical protein
MCPRNQATDYPPLRASCRFKGCLAVTESRALTPNIGSSSACSIRQTSRNRRSRCQCTGRQAPLQRRVDSREPGRFTPPADLRFWTLLPLEGPTGRRRRRNYGDISPAMRQRHSARFGGTKRTGSGERLEVSRHADAIHANRECIRVAEGLRDFASTGVNAPATIFRTYWTNGLVDRNRR